MSNVQEDTIIERLLDITPPEGEPVELSDFPYREMADRPWSGYLPEVPTKPTPENLNEYVKKLTSFRYHASVSKVIERSLLSVIEATPELLTKESYLGIVGHFHFMVQDSICFKVLDKMSEETELSQDIDFDNALLSYANCITDYRPRITRLEKLRDHNVMANNNTWYSVFRMFRRMDPKLQLLELMDDHKISHKPILYSAVHYLSKSYTPEQLVQYYEREGKNGAELTTYLLNRLVGSYLSYSRLDEAWDLTKKAQLDTGNKVKVNGGTFAEFSRYFANRGELYNCIAFSDLFSRTFKLQTRQILANDLLERQLPVADFFDNWFTLVNVMADVLKNTSHNKSFLNKRTVRKLQEYAKLHGKPNFDPLQADDKSLLLRDELFSNLKWNANEHLLSSDLAQNSEEFQKAAALITSPKKGSNLYSPSEFL
ncbi:DEKNAAC105372 [Brettanomyces naardenensis]|uniref:DEKNAAC105372 n=1 Tax=Brettanomyces naardenensis TaxID=13370 RepID=A0A448YT81_BRENA|nr:DEKNAAC105372 [Brettanomyces naardenensis]